MFDRPDLDSLEDRVGFQKVTLEFLKLAVDRRVSEHEMAIGNMSLETSVDYISRDMVYRLTARIASEKLNSIQYPEDWKQAFKERWFPKWLVKKFPIKYTVYVATVLYPSISLPENQHYIQLFKR